MRQMILFILIAFSLFSCTEDDALRTINDEPINYTLEYNSTIPITTYVKVSGDDGVIYDFGSYTENQATVMIDKRGTIIISTYSQGADYILNYEVINNENNTTIITDDYACGLGDCYIEIDY